MKRDTVVVEVCRVPRLKEAKFLFYFTGRVIAFHCGCAFDRAAEFCGLVYVFSDSTHGVIYTADIFPI